MLLNHAIHPAVLRLIAGIAAVTLLALALIAGAVSPARAQMDASVSAEFRTALEPHGKWQRHNRWGEVWTPAKRERGWRPYTVGQWVYTDDWGWYWTSADAEAEWGWVTYHYGRWVLDDDLGWVWLPGNEWGPGWVNWRRGDDHFGWAPLPPDNVIVEYRDKPDAWVFVRSRDFVAPVIARVIVPVAEYRMIIQRTVVVNRTVVIRDRRIAVNPGIPPAIIAARVGRPIRAFDVRPVVLAGTVRIQNAVEVRGADLRQGGRDRVRVTVRETQETIQPAKDVPKPRPLAANEQGRLGDNPPRAARQDAREERRDDRRDARDERQDDRRDAREDRRDQRQDDRRDAREHRRDQRPDDRRDAREDRRDQRQDDRRDAREDRRDQRQERQGAQEQKREQRQERQGAQEQKREQRQERQGAQEQKREQRQERQGPQEQKREQRQERQGAQDQRGRPGAGQTEGRSPPAAREPDQGSPAARDNAPQRSEPRVRQQPDRRDSGGGGADRRGERN